MNQINTAIVPRTSSCSLLHCLRILLILPTDRIRRDGFESAYGRFYALPGRVEVEDGQTLRRMFLPKLTPEASKRLDREYDFVRSQLRHYDVEFDEAQFTGQGTLLFKKVLTAGKVWISIGPCGTASWNDVSSTLVRSSMTDEAYFVVRQGAGAH